MGKIVQGLVAIGLMALVYNVGLYFLKKDVVEVMAAKTGAKLASFTPESFGFAKRLTSVEVSHDGKTVAVAGGARLALFDFASAFETAPLPARPIARDAEYYPFEK